MRELVTHLRDLLPRDVGLGRGGGRIEVFDRLPDLDEANANRIEHDAVVVGSCRVVLDHPARDEDVSESGS
ncbi:hypothetical protein GCM10011372_36330 [Agromyces bauzanensis]|uniref:Uncharacterized protein n=1 Tax=Agromyces bauzanensis TaxID=1308924 RepID=A0A917UY22_9MICO|nr:hypothetical protein GCM10011372_36330 [Agromyces bauzanensis]